MKKGDGYLTGSEAEFEYMLNRVEQGVLYGPPTTASTQATSTGAYDFNVNRSHGIVVVEGKRLELAAAADVDLANGGTGTAILASGESIYYTQVAYLLPGAAAPAIRQFAGTIALAAAAVPITDAAINASFGPDVPWFRLADLKVNRTGDTTVTQSYNNLVRPSGIPATINRK